MPIYFPFASQLLGFIRGGTSGWIFRPCKSPWTLAEDAGAFPWDLRRHTTQAVGRTLSYFHSVEATLGAAPWTPPKWVKVILWLLKAVLRAGRECGVTGKYGHHWDVGGNGISVLQGLSPEVLRGGGSGAYGHGMLRGDVSPSGFELGVAESRVPPLTPRHFAGRTSLPQSTRVVHAT